MPADELAETGVTFPVQIPEEDNLLTELLTELLTKISPVIKRWSDTCSQHLEEGLTYVMSVRHRRLRFAAALPLNLAARTHALLKNATPEELISRIKISKPEVKKIAKKTAIGMFSARHHCKLFRALSA